MSPTSPSPSPILPSFAGKNVLVMGLGHFGGGLGAARWLVSQGATVTVTDAVPAEKLVEPLKSLEGLPITFKLGGHDAADLDRADLLVINPAVDRAKSTFVQAARARNIPTTTEMNLFLERCPALAVGITGSVGKSTTTALIYEALKAALGQTSDELANIPALETRNREEEFKTPRVFLGGNIGRSLLLDLPAIRPIDIIVLELSSFMLEETPAIQWSPHIAVITNIFPNHLDRHQTMAAYSAAKQNILRFQKPGDIAILNNDHELVCRWVHLARGRVIKFTTRGPWAGKGQMHMDLSMPGAHNQSNAAAALAVLSALGAELSAPSAAPNTSSRITHRSSPAFNRAAARAAIEQFPGLAHRLECVHTLELPASGETPARRIRFYNDSKATTPDASITAVQAFAPRAAVFILGGYDKGLAPAAFEPFGKLLVQRARAVVGIGQTGPALLAQLHDLAAAENIALPAVYAGTLERAVPLARQWALEMDAQAVVLSPASASWDQFPNYQKRGELFAQLSRETHMKPPATE